MGFHMAALAAYGRSFVPLCHDNPFDYDLRDIVVLIIAEFRLMMIFVFQL